MLRLFKRNGNKGRSNNVVVHDRELLVRYPPLRNGVPFYSTDDVLFPNQSLIENIRSTVRFDYQQNSELLLPLLHKFTDYVHLLPASEHDHHRAAGGLIRHSLEVAYYSALTATTAVFGVDQGDHYQSKVKDRYIYAAFLAGLLHDIGKVFSDMIVSTFDGESTWLPMFSPIQDWFAKNKTHQQYKVSFRTKSRHKLHESFPAYMFSRIVTPADIDYLTRSGEFSEIPEAIVFALSKNPIAANMPDVALLMKLVTRADSRSTKRDLAGNTDVHGEEQAGIPVFEAVVSKLVDLLKNEVIPSTGPNSRIFKEGSRICLLWTESSAFKVIDACLDAGINLPENSSKVFTILYRANIIKGINDGTSPIPFTFSINGIQKKVNGFYISHPALTELCKNLDLISVTPVTKETAPPTPSVSKPAENNSKKDTKNRPPEHSLNFTPSINPEKNDQSIKQNNTELDFDLDFGGQTDNSAENTPKKQKPTAKNPSTTKPSAEAKPKPKEKVTSENIGTQLSALISAGKTSEFETQNDGDVYLLKGNRDEIYKMVSSALALKKYVVRQLIEGNLEIKQLELNNIEIKVPLTCHT